MISQVRKEVLQWDGPSVYFVSSSTLVLTIFTKFLTHFYWRGGENLREGLEGEDKEEKGNYRKSCMENICR